MVSLVISDEKLAGFCSAIMDAGMRNVIFSLLDGPLSRDNVAESIEISGGEASALLNNLLSLGLVRKIDTSNQAIELYALDFSIEKLGSHHDPQMINMLSNDLSKDIYKFLESHSDEIAVSIDASGSSLGRTVEQILMSVFSRVLKDYQDEIKEEDKRISESVGKGKGIE
jgi:hypothetical protein